MKSITNGEKQLRVMQYILHRHPNITVGKAAHLMNMWFNKTGNVFTIKGWMMKNKESYINGIGFDMPTIYSDYMGDDCMGFGYGSTIVYEYELDEEEEE